MCDHAFSPSAAPQPACGKMSDAAHPPPPAMACGIRGCLEAACAPEYHPGPGLWTTRCKRTGISTDGSSRPSWHHALWNTQCKTWMWTCRGLTSRSSRSQAIVSIEAADPTNPIQDCRSSGQVLCDGPDDAQTQPGAPAMLQHDIPEHMQEDIILDTDQVQLVMFVFLCISQQFLVLFLNQSSK